MSASPPPPPRHRVERAEPELARRLAKLQSILDLAKSLTAERRLDRLLEGVVDANRPTVLPAEASAQAALLGVLVEAGVWPETARAA